MKRLHEYKEETSKLDASVKVIVTRKDDGFYGKVSHHFSSHGNAFLHTDSRTIFIDGEEADAENWTPDHYLFVEAHEIVHLRLRHTPETADEAHTDYCAIYLLADRGHDEAAKIGITQFKYRNGISFKEYKKKIKSGNPMKEQAWASTDGKPLDFKYDPGKGKLKEQVNIKKHGRFGQTGVPFPQEYPNEFAYIDFKKWAKGGEKKIKKQLSKVGDNKMFKAIEDIWTIWDKKNNDGAFSNIKGNKFGRELVKMLWKDNIIFNKKKHKIISLKEQKNMNLRKMIAEEYYKLVKEGKLNEISVKAGFEDIKKGSTTTIDGVKISKDMVAAIMDWMAMSAYGRKYHKQIMKGSIHALLKPADAWGIERFLKSGKLKREWKAIIKKHKPKREGVNEQSQFFGPDAVPPPERRKKKVRILGVPMYDETPEEVDARRGRIKQKGIEQDRITGLKDELGGSWGPFMKKDSWADKVNQAIKVGELDPSRDDWDDHAAEWKSHVGDMESGIDPTTYTLGTDKLGESIDNMIMRELTEQMTPSQVKFLSGQLKLKKGDKITYDQHFQFGKVSKNTTAKVVAVKGHTVFLDKGPELDLRMDPIKKVNNKAIK